METKCGEFRSTRLAKNEPMSSYLTRAPFQQTRALPASQPLAAWDVSPIEGGNKLAMQDQQGTANQQLPPLACAMQGSVTLRSASPDDQVGKFPSSCKVFEPGNGLVGTILDATPPPPDDVLY